MKSLRVALIAGIALASAPTPSCDEIAWVASLTEARSRAAAEERGILVYFWMEDSAFCSRMYAETLTTPAGRAELAEFVCVSARAGTPETAEWVDRFAVPTLPSVVFLDADGVAQDALHGFIALDPFLQASGRIREGRGTVADWKRRASEAPDDLDVRLGLAIQLEHVGSLEECGRLLDSIRRDDPEGRTLGGARLALNDVLERTRNAAADPADPRTYDLEPLYAHVPGIGPPSVRFSAWRWIADVEQTRGDHERERAALVGGWEAAPDDQRISWGYQLVRRFFQMQDELSPEERTLARSAGEYVFQTASEVHERDPAAVNMDVAHEAVALGLALDGRPGEARLHLEKAIEIDPTQARYARLRDSLESEAR